MSKSNLPDPAAFLPLSPPVFQILLTMGEASMHGYGIIQEFEARTGQRGALLPGSLYNTMSRMVKAGLIVETKERPAASEDDERRRYYKVTTLGRSVAIAETTRMKSLLQLAAERELIPEVAEG